MARTRTLRSLRGYRATKRRELDALEDKMDDTTNEEELKELRVQRRALRDEIRDIDDDINEMSGDDDAGDDKGGDDKGGDDKGGDDKGGDDKGGDDKGGDDKGGDRDTPPPRQHWSERKLFGGRSR